MTMMPKPKYDRVTSNRLFVDSYDTAEWDKLSTEAKVRDGHRCVDCREEDKGKPQVHHMFYTFERLAWEYPVESLHTLCRQCHLERTVLTKQIKILSGMLTNTEGQEIRAKMESMVNRRGLVPLAREAYMIMMNRKSSDSWG